MKLQINSSEIAGENKQAILDLLELNWLEADYHFCDGAKLAMSPEIVMDRQMYLARMNVPLTPEAEEWEIRGWAEAQKQVDGYLNDRPNYFRVDCFSNYKVNRKKIKFVKYDWAKGRDIEAEDPIERAKRAYQVETTAWDD